MLKTILSSSRIVGRFSYRVLDKVTGGALSIIGNTFAEFIRFQALDVAAGMAYYTLLSFFPLMLFIVSILGFVLEQGTVQHRVFELLNDLIPISNQEFLNFAEQNLEALVQRRGPASMLATITLLWAGSNVFTALARSINRAWHTQAEPLSFLRGRLIAFIMISVLALFLILSLISSTILGLLDRFQVPLGGGVTIYDTFIWTLVTRFVPIFFSFALFLALYRWVPNTKVKWSEAFWGALAATLGWRLALAGFAWSINTGLVNYQLLYGSLATIVAAMLWIYISSLIVLFGAYLSASIADHHRPAWADEVSPATSP